MMPDTRTHPLLQLRNLEQSYDDLEVVRGLSFQLARGAIGCLLGASGCGKTTVLRCIAGFEPVGGGEIILDGRVVSRPGLIVPPEARQIGMVFQDFALFPHRTVAGNIAFGLRRLTPGERTRRVDEMLDVIGLVETRDKYPHELSGGQQQRVALARALAPRPQLLLLDEPFSNLDVELRERLSVEVRDILKKQNTTAVLVTHDQNEAFNIADEIGVMRAGTLVQWATPYTIYHEPATRFVADFVGQGVFLPGTVVPGNRIEGELGTLTADSVLSWPAGTPVEVLLRPDDIQHDDASPLQAEVAHKAFRGAEFLYTLKLPGGRHVLSLVPSHHDHPLGEKIGIRLDVSHVVAFPRAP